MKKKAITVSSLVVKLLENKGVKYAFGLTGSAIEPTVLDLSCSEKIEYMQTATEAGAVRIAHGYASTKKELVVCVATAGPGGLNMLPAAVAAQKDGVPILLIIGEVKTSVQGKGSIQDSSNIMIPAFASGVRKAWRINNAKEAQGIFEEAIECATAAPFGVTVVSLPFDIAEQEVHFTEKLSCVSRDFLPKVKVDEIVRVLLDAKTPLIFAGNGVEMAEASGELLHLAELLGARVATSPKAKGVFPENHPESYGVFGLAGQAKITDKHHDVLLVLGCLLGETQTNGGSKSILPTKCLIQVDLNRGVINKNYHCDFHVSVDIKYFLKKIIAGVSKVRDRKTYKRISCGTTEKFAKDGLYHPHGLMNDIQKMFNDDPIFVLDAGSSSFWAINKLRINKPNSFKAPFGFWGMGFGCHAAIGVKLAVGGSRDVVAIVGDGAVLMESQEIKFAVDNKIPIVVFIMNNCGYIMVEQGRVMLGYSDRAKVSAKLDKRIDFAGIAKAMGATAIRVDSGMSIFDFDQEIKTSLGEGTPVFVDVYSDPDIDIKPLIKERIRVLLGK